MINLHKKNINLYSYVDLMKVKSPSPQPINLTLEQTFMILLKGGYPHLLIEYSIEKYRIYVPNIQCSINVYRDPFKYLITDQFVVILKLKCAVWMRRRRISYFDN